MTEAEWLVCTDPIPMLEYLRTQSTTTNRKVRLFAAACCRRIWNWLDEKSRRAVEVLERHVDGQVMDAELYYAANRVEEECLAEFGHNLLANAVYYAVTVQNQNMTVHELIFGAARAVAEAVRCKGGDKALIAERAAQCHLLRDIFHGPRRAVFVRRHWRIVPVRNLASSIYHDRAFDRLPVLVNALADAGCHEEEILHHCLQPGEHVRGCWVVDAFLGKF